MSHETTDAVARRLERLESAHERMAARLRAYYYLVPMAFTLVGTLLPWASLEPRFVDGGLSDNWWQQMVRFGLFGDDSGLLRPVLIVVGVLGVVMAVGALRRGLAPQPPHDRSIPLAIVGVLIALGVIANAVALATVELPASYNTVITDTYLTGPIVTIVGSLWLAVVCALPPDRA